MPAPHTMPPQATDPRAPMNWRRRLLRLCITLLGGYVGIVLVMMLLENWLVFPAVRAEQLWFPPPAPGFQDVEFDSADGTRIHAWWCPRPGADRALLFCHGNGGNLSFS